MARCELQKNELKPLKSLYRAQNRTCAQNFDPEQAKGQPSDRSALRRRCFHRPLGLIITQCERRTLTPCHPTVLERSYLAARSLTSRRLRVEVLSDRLSASELKFGFASPSSSTAGRPSGTPSLWRWPASQAPPSLTRSLHQTLGRLHLSRLRPPPGPSLRTLRACPTPLPSPCHS
jgi:hypothetical protein